MQMITVKSVQMRPTLPERGPPGLQTSQLQQPPTSPESGLGRSPGAVGLPKAGVETCFPGIHSAAEAKVSNRKGG